MITNRFRSKDKVIITQNNAVVCETYDECSLIHRLKTWMGIGNYATDLLLDKGIEDITAMIAARYDYISYGTGTTAPSASDLQLESEVERVQCTSKIISTTFTTNDTVTFRTTFTPSNSHDITEVGIHKNATTSGDITLARETFSAFAAVGGVSFDIAYSIITMR
jgi:hypothetical protein